MASFRNSNNSICPNLFQRSPTLSFGRGFSPACLITYNNISQAGEREYEGFDWNVNVPCNQIPGASDTIESFKTVSNISKVNQLVTVKYNCLNYVILGAA